MPTEDQTADENQRIKLEATRQLTGLESALQNILSQVREGRLSQQMAKSKDEIAALLWSEGNKALLQLEAISGPQPRRDTFVEAYAQVKTELRKVYAVEVPPTPQLDVTLASTPSRSDHLPRIELPKFNGDPSEWPAFAGRFEKRIVGLTGDAERYAFLIKCFDRCDIARNSCEAFENAGMPFERAWSKLEERFYKKRVAFLSHFNYLRDLPKMTVASSNGLMRIIDVVETSTSAAKQIAGASGQRPSVVEDGMLVSLVMSKLDDETITRISRRLDVHTIPTWKELRDELDRLSSSLYYEPRKSAASRPDRASTSSKRPIRAAFVATVDTVSTSQTPTPQTQRTRYSSVDHQPGTRRCYACDKPGHTGPLCPELQVRSECERINYVMSKGKCVNCLSSQHPASQCPSNKRCQVCRQKHHTLLHVKSSEAAK